MKQTRNLRKAWPGAALLFAGVFFAAGCSTGNSGSGLNLITPGGSHPAGFASTHPSLVLSSSDTSLCQPCHGDALDGGIAKVSCFSTSRNGVACHHFSPTWGDPTEHGASAKRAPGNSSFLVCRICHGNDFSGGGSAVSCFDCHGVSAPHPSRPWLGTSPAVTHTNTDSVNAAVCIDCHAGGANTNPPHPPPTPAAAGTAPGCFNGTLCHNFVAGGANHAVPFFDNTHFQATQTNFSNNCSNCHAVTGTSPVSAAPLCTVCHAAGSPLTLTGCTSCHANPPNGGTGSAYPTIAGAHAAHIALNAAVTPVSCDTCHNGLGTNTLNHYNRANARSGSNALRVPPGDAAFPATYNAKTGASSFSNTALTCSNMSCHGGQATPNWQTGSLTVNTQCTSCHAQGTAQFNSYNSGQHSRSEHVSAGCTACHNTTKLADPAAGKHFLNLSTTALDVRASATIAGTGTSIPEGNYVPGATVGTGSCNPSCHGTESW
ncbi:MAG: CxxxxCH/CxxCH domain-containing protein [Deltaproteobacteria bacterium]|nr:CxxxxCH/CxxCH domain-containing protein [Deltaproteobacteria bacterium]